MVCTIKVCAVIVFLTVKLSADDAVKANEAVIAEVAVSALPFKDALIDD